MAQTAGALSRVLVGQSNASLSSAVATGGVGPYNYQWCRSTTNGFTPGPSNQIAGATALTLNDSGLQPGTTYYYVVETFDTGSGNLQVNSAQFTVNTELGQLQNQFAQNQMAGLIDLRVGPTNLISAQVDPSLASNAAPFNVIYPGQAVKIVANTVGGIPRVVPCQAKADQCIGFVAFNIKDLSYGVGQNLEVAMWGSTIWLYATGTIAQFAECCLDVTYVGGVQATGNTATWVGQAIDGAGSGGGLIRVQLMPNVSFATA